MQKKYFEFDVALSFAGEQREFVEVVARHLKKDCLRIYYDKYELIDSWGENLFDHLDEVYSQKAKYCVIFISEDYKRKVWTRYERERAQIRAYRDTTAYIFPFRFDDTVIAGLDDIIYLPRAEFDEKKLAGAIIDKVKKNDRQLYHFRKVKCFFARRIRSITAVLTAGILAFSFSDNLTPVDILAERIHEQSKYRPVICRDGKISRSSGGRGTCSHHGGVHHISDTMAYDKTIQQCRKEAAEISWLGQ